MATEPTVRRDPDTLQATARPLIALRGVSKTFQNAAGTFNALDNVSLQVNQGEFLAIIGKSGSGKSTLLNMLTGIDRPSTGEVLAGNLQLHRLSEDELARWRSTQLGIVFQFFQLLPTLSVLENVMLPMDFCNAIPVKERKQRARALLAQVDMAGHAAKPPSAISGGQQQRVAIARALANDPPLLVADEPTGNLDSRTASAIFQLFNELVRQGKTIVMVTHDDELAQQADRTLVLSDGRIVNEIHRGREGHHA